MWSTTWYPLPLHCPPSLDLFGETGIDFTSHSRAALQGLTLDDPITESRSTTHTSPGEIIAGRYEIVRLIARGGMGSVYEARQLQLDRVVAIKFFQPHREHLDHEVETFERRFEVEAASLARLSHANIVSVFDYGRTDDGRSFLVMEHVQGRTLSQVLKEEAPLSVYRSLELLLQVCYALRSAHGQGVVHRDLKPSNLLIREEADGRELVKVVDFGLVKLTQEDQSITIDGLIMGSPHYMSPEQVKGIDTDERSDLYSLGALLFRCVTGCTPFQGSTTTATMMAHVQHPAPGFAARAPALELPAELERIVLRCLEKPPEQRYQRVADLIQELEMFRAELDSADGSVISLATSIESEPVDPEPEPPRRRVAPLLLGGGLALVVLLGGVLALSGLLEPDSDPVAELPPEVVEQAVSLPVQVRFASDPPGAEILLGDDVVGTTPFVYETSTTGVEDWRLFQVRLDGYLGRSIEHDLSLGGEQRVDIELVAVPAAAPPSPAPVQPPEQPPEVPAQQPQTTVDGYKSSPYD